MPLLLFAVSDTRIVLPPAEWLVNINVRLTESPSLCWKRLGRYALFSRG